MSGQTVVRAVVGAVGVAIGAYGALLLSDDPTGRLVTIAKWLAGGVIVHDFVIAPLTLLVWALLRRVLPPVARGPVAAGLVVLGTVTLMGIPALFRMGAKATNPTLLDRDYTLGWVALAVVVALGVAAALVVRLRRGDE